MTLNAADTGGAGVQKTQYALPGSGVWTDADANNQFTVPGPADHSGDGVHLYDVRALDNAGNVSATGSVTVRIDTTAPQTQALTSDGRAADASTWHAAPLTVSFAPSDPAAADGSCSGMTGGLATTQYSTDGGATWQSGASLAFSARWKRGGGSGSFPVFVRSTDAAGNTETPRPVTVNIDTSAPTSSAMLGAVAGGQATVYLQGSDALSGVASLWYSLDGGAWTQAAYPGDPGLAVTVSGVGAHTLSYYAIDGVGNQQAGYNVNLVTVTGSTQATLSNVPAIAPTPPAHTTPHRHPRPSHRPHRARRR